MKLFEFTVYTGEGKTIWHSEGDDAADAYRNSGSTIKIYETLLDAGVHKSGEVSIHIQELAGNFSDDVDPKSRDTTAEEWVEDNFVTDEMTGLSYLK